MQVLQRLIAVLRGARRGGQFVHNEALIPTLSTSSCGSSCHACSLPYCSALPPRRLIVTLTDLGVAHSCRVSSISAAPRVLHSPAQP